MIRTANCLTTLTLCVCVVYCTLFLLLNFCKLQGTTGIKFLLTHRTYGFLFVNDDAFMYTEH